LSVISTSQPQLDSFSGCGLDVGGYIFLCRLSVVCSPEKH
jgi:hypothetical protein